MQERRVAWLWCACMAVMLLAGQAVSQTASQAVVSQATSQPAQKPQFTFGVISDTHIGSAEQLGRFRAFVHTIQDRKIDFLLILGDLCGHAPEYLPQMREVIDKSGLKVYTIPGNHDDNYGQNPEWYNAVFEPVYYSFDHKGWHFVMSDSQVPPPAEWLQKELTAGNGKTPVVFCQHYPPMPKQGDDQMPWAELAKHPNVKLVMVGHAHVRAARQFAAVPFEIMDNASFGGGEDAGGYSIVEVVPGGGTHIQDFPMAKLALREPADKTPTVAIHSPRTGDVLRNSTVFRGTAGDDSRLKQVEYSVDYGKWHGAEGTRAWTFTLDTAALADGHHLIRVRAVDSADQPSIALAEVLAMVENHPPQAGRVFRFQQGVDGYAGCEDVTIRKQPAAKDASGEEGEVSDLECWVWDKGQSEFSEFYIRFDLATSGIPKGAKIKRATLTLFGSRQNQVDAAGKACRYYVGVMRQAWTTDMTFQTRPDKPGWFVSDKPQIQPELELAWPYLGGRQLIVPPRPVVIDLTPIKQVVQAWLQEPASNHGLVISPAPGREYNMSAKGSRYGIVTLRPKLEIEIEP